MKNGNKNFSAFSLRPGLQIYGASLEPDKIRIRDGIEEGREDFYCNGAAVPRLPSRPPTKSELAILLHSNHNLSDRNDIDPANSIAVIETPPEIRQCFVPLLSGLKAEIESSGAFITAPTTGPETAVYAGPSGKRTGVSPWRLSQIDQEHFARTIVQAKRFAKTILLPPRTNAPVRSHWRILGRCPGLRTCTFDHSSQLLIGLHIDNFFERQLEERPFSPNRLCINVGDEPRYFLFINLSLLACRELLRSAGCQDKELTRAGWRLDTLFFDRFPDYPIVELRIDPGEAYISPTENIIHDSTTIYTKSADASLTILDGGGFNIAKGLRGSGVGDDPSQSS